MMATSSAFTNTPDRAFNGPRPPWRKDNPAALRHSGLDADPTPPTYLSAAELDILRTQQRRIKYGPAFWLS
jgi:hypothetical protein